MTTRQPASRAVTISRARVSDAPALTALAAATFPLACPPGTTPDDIEAFLATTLSQGAFTAYLQDPSRTVLLARRDGDDALLGYSMSVIGPVADPEVQAALATTASASGIADPGNDTAPIMELSKFYVARSEHGTGVAGQLMTATLQLASHRGARLVWLGVNQLNVRAAAFYRKFGFTTAGTKHFQVGSQWHDDFVLATTVRGPLLLLRHGQSTANADGLFTGVLDVPLSPHGEAEAAEAARLITTAGLHPTMIVTSELRRAWHTADIVAGGLAQRVIPERDWRLNERNYGALTTRSKTEVKAEFGEAQFLRWRRSVTVAPPAMDDALLERIAAREPFNRLPAEALTRSESLADVMARVAAFHSDRVVPALSAGHCVLVVAHGNSLRAYCAVLDDLPAQAIEHLNLPTGHPLVYDTDRAGLPLAGTGRYLDEPRALAAAEILRSEGGT